MFNAQSAANYSAKSPTRTAAAATAACTLEVYRDLQSLEPIWQRLEAGGHATVFQTWSVFKAWAEHIAAPQHKSWMVIGIFDPLTRQPQMLLPIAVSRDDGMVVVEFADLGVADFNGPVLAANYRPGAAEMKRTWYAILDALPAGDLLRLTKIPPVINGMRNPLLDVPGLQRMNLAAFGMPITAAGLERERFGIDPALLNDIDTRTRKLEKRGRVTFEVAREASLAQPAFDAMCAQRAERHLALKRPNILAQPSTCEFYRSLFNQNGRPGPALIASLKIDNSIIATGYGLAHGNTFHMIFPTFKADRWRNYSPGLQIFLRTIRWAGENGFTYFDFTIGAEQFKRDFGAIERPLYEKHMALSPRALPLVMAHKVKHVIRQSHARRNGRSRASACLAH